jgi:hypothetical protein
MRELGLVAAEKTAETRTVKHHDDPLGPTETLSYDLCKKDFRKPTGMRAHMASNSHGRKLVEAGATVEKVHRVPISRQSRVSGTDDHRLLLRNRKL